MGVRWPRPRTGLEAEVLLDLLGSDAVELQRLFSELREIVPDLPPAPEAASA